MKLADLKLFQLLPFSAWIGELKDPKILKADLIAGITVTTVLIPQAMAHAQLASLPPYYGLYAAFLPPIIAALFGSSRHLTSGSVALVSLMTAAALQPFAVPGSSEHIAYAVVLTMMVGLIQLFLGAFRLGVLVNFLSHPVILGFTNAAAIIIGTSQIDMLFGVEVLPGGSHFTRVWTMFSESYAHPHMPTVGIAVLAFAVMIVLKWWDPRSPWVLTAVILTTTLSWYTDFEAVYGGRVVGRIPEGLPKFVVPGISFSLFVKLFMAAATIAFIAFVETISIAKAIATQSKQRIGANRELLGQGLANLVGSAFQSMPVSGSFVRSALNFRSGARTGFSSVTAGCLVLVTLLWLTPLFYHLPLATLAAIIMMAVAGLIQIDPIVRAWRAQKHDGVVATATFILTLFFAPHLDLGILIGVGLSLFAYLYRTMMPRVVSLSRHPDGTFRDVDAMDIQSCEHVVLIRFDGSLYFGSAGYFEDKILERVANMPDLKFLVIDAEGINHVDATGEKMLLHTVQGLKETGIETYSTRIKRQVSESLDRTGFTNEVGENHFHRSLYRVLSAVWNRLEADSPCERGCPQNCPLNRAELPKGVVNYRV
ncbi:MAG: SulP family inorganic anion transporter [Candidatus Latescibacterota bacterium]|nr:SulP family inorganic anion transporter [Candidatus Latescibacterota bacterium]